jgi:hypothetical protein
LQTRKRRRKQSPSSIGEGEEEEENARGFIFFGADVWSFKMHERRRGNVVRKEKKAAEMIYPSRREEFKFHVDR